MPQVQSALLLLLALCAAVRGQCRSSFEEVNASLCINSEFTEVISDSSMGESATADLQCSVQCSIRQRCQAFSTADGPCQLFVFDRCSKGVRNCSCSRTGRLFVKSQPGLQPGLLCPAGYAQERCGVKYKAYPSPGYWWDARQRCENDSGLVIMADVEDAAEMSFIDSHFNAEYFSQSKSLWLGGFQSPASPKSKFGWRWVSCNTSVDSNLWSSYPTGQPDNILGGEVTIGRFYESPGLNDFSPSTLSYKPSAVLCKCVSPFE